MNPFDLSGPPFLLFYVCFSAAVVLLLRYVIRTLEAARPFSKAIVLEDPYALALLRGGQAEATRVATVALIDRGLLKARPHGLVASVPKAAAYARRPIEQAILSAFASSDAAINVVKSAPTALEAACDAYKHELRSLGLLVSSDNIPGRLIPFVLAVLLVEGMAAIKIAVALSRHRYNIEFLVILAIIAFVVLVKSVVRPRTGYGDLVLNQHRDRFSQLKRRAARVRPGGATNEATLLAALWGLSVLPTAGFPYVRDLFPKASGTGSDSWSGGCGGGSSDGGGGGGCGGGGCGGGCGGCGG